MGDDDLLEFLRCPESGSTVQPAEPQLVARLNGAIRAGRLLNVSGQLVAHEIDGGLVRAEGDVLYPIVDQIPVMLHDEAIRLDQMSE